MPIKLVKGQGQAAPTEPALLAEDPAAPRKGGDLRTAQSEEGDTTLVLSLIEGQSALWKPPA